MRRFFRLVGRALGVLLALLIAAAAIAYSGSEWILRRRHAVPLPASPAPADALAADASARDAEGRRLAILVGCLHGCHGAEGGGGVVDAPGIFRVEAPALGSVLPAYSDAELARLVRLGVRRDGTSAVGMPTATFFPIADEDLALIAAHLRRRPETPPARRSVRVEPLGRLALVLGKWKLSADQVDALAPRWGELPRPGPFERGRYLASITCSECHGTDLAGEEYMASPPLSAARAYDLPAFARLLRQGVHLSGRSDGLMSETARAAFVVFTDDEIAALHAFLLARFAPADEARDGAPR